MFSEIKTHRLGFYELFVFAIKILRKYFLSICMVTFLISIPLYAIEALIPQSLIVTQQDIIDQNMDKIIKNFILSLGFSILFSPLLIAGYTYISRQAIEEKPAKFTEILDVSILKWPRHILTMSLFIAIILSTCILIIPAIYFNVVFNFSIAIVAITDKWGLGAFKESYRLIKGNFLYTFAVIIATTFLEIFFKFFVGNIKIFDNGILYIVTNVLYRSLFDVVLCVFQLMMLVYFLNLFYIKDDRIIEE